MADAGESVHEAAAKSAEGEEYNARERHGGDEEDDENHGAHGPRHA